MLTAKKKEVNSMPTKNTHDGLADYAISIRLGKRESFLEKIDVHIKWKKIEKILASKYRKQYNVVGEAAYPALVMFKILLVQTWYDFSDPKMEDALWHNLLFIRFVGLSVTSDVPDHSTICRFRNALVKLNLYEELFQEVQKQLEGQNLIVKKGVVVDASLVKSSRRPPAKKKVKAEAEIKEDGKQDEGEVLEAKDPDASWGGKKNWMVYGYKAHVAVDKDTGIIVSCHMTTAKASDTREFKKVVSRASVLPGASVTADKGYTSEENSNFLRLRQHRDRIMKKEKVNRKLTKWEKVFNRMISKYRYIVEQVFGSLKRNYALSRLRYTGLEKAEAQLYLKAMAWNIKKAVTLSECRCRAL